MTDFHEKGFSCIKLLNPKFPRRARKEVDLDEIVALLSQVVGRPIETLPIPNTPAFHDLVKEVEKVSELLPGLNKCETDQLEHVQMLGTVRKKMAETHNNIAAPHSLFEQQRNC